MNEDLFATGLGCLLGVGAIVLAIAVGLSWSVFVGWLIMFVAGIFFVVPPMTVWHYLAIGIVINWFMPKPAVVQSKK